MTEIERLQTQVYIAQHEARQAASGVRAEVQSVIYLAFADLGPTLAEWRDSDDWAVRRLGSLREKLLAIATATD